MITHGGRNDPDAALLLYLAAGSPYSFMKALSEANGRHSRRAR